MRTSFCFTVEYPYLLHSLHTPQVKHRTWHVKKAQQTQLNKLNKKHLTFCPLQLCVFHLPGQICPSSFSPTPSDLWCLETLHQMFLSQSFCLPLLCQITPFSRLLQYIILDCHSHYQMVVQFLLDSTSPMDVKFLQCQDNVTFFHVPAQCQAQ